MPHMAKNTEKLMQSLYNIQMAIHRVRTSNTKRRFELLKQLRDILEEYYKEIVTVLAEFNSFAREVGRLLKKYQECEPVQIVYFLRELVEKCEACRLQVQRLIEIHDSVQDLFGRIEVSFRNGQSTGLDESMAMFASSCEALRREVENITPFFDGEVNKCEAYLKAAEGRSEGASIRRAREFANRWANYLPVLKQAMSDIEKNCDALILLPKDDKKSRCMIV